MTGPKVTRRRSLLGGLKPGTFQDLVLKLFPFTARDIKMGADNALQEGAQSSVLGSIRVLEGQGNSITLGAGAILKGHIRIRGRGNTVIFGANSKFGGSLSVRGDNQTVIFGEKSTSVGAKILCQENCDVRIGRDCMLSRDIDIRTTDSHSVIDRTTGARLNTAGSVIIGDHVWIGVEAMIGKGSVIPQDCIIGAKSFVSGTFEQSGAVIAGVPARVRRTGVTWDRQRKDQFTEDEMSDWQAGD